MPRSARPAVRHPGTLGSPGHPVTVSPESDRAPGTEEAYPMTNKTPADLANDPTHMIDDARPDVEIPEDER